MARTRIENRNKGLFLSLLDGDPKGSIVTAGPKLFDKDNDVVTSECWTSSLPFANERWERTCCCGRHDRHTVTHHRTPKGVVRRIRLLWCTKFPIIEKLCDQAIFGNSLRSIRLIRHRESRSLLNNGHNLRKHCIYDRARDDRHKKAKIMSDASQNHEWYDRPMHHNSEIKGKLCCSF